MHSCPRARVYYRYAIDLRSLTGGRGRFAMAHDHYDVMPSHLIDRIRKDVHEGD